MEIVCLNRLGVPRAETAAHQQIGVHLISVSKVTVRIASNGADLAA